MRFQYLLKKIPLCSEKNVIYINVTFTYSIVSNLTFFISIIFESWDYAVNNVFLNVWCYQRFKKSNFINFNLIKFPKTMSIEFDLNIVCFRKIRTYSSFSKRKVFKGYRCESGPLDSLKSSNHVEGLYLFYNLKKYWF